jgi:hypothetical protein
MQGIVDQDPTSLADLVGRDRQRQRDDGDVGVAAGREPLRVVFRDNGFVSDAVKINVEQIFRQLSPTTDVKSI